MADLSGSFREVLRSPRPPEAVIQHLLDRDRIAAATDHVERYELVGADTLHYVLAEQKHGPYTFKPDYRVRYVRQGNSVVWTPVEPSNLRNKGSAKVEADGAGSKITWEQEITFDLAIPWMVLPVIRPVVDAILSPALRKLAQTMVSTVP